MRAYIKGEMKGEMKGEVERAMASCITYFKYGLFVLSFLAFMVSCNKENAWDCVKTTGEDVELVRELTGVQALNIKDDFIIQLVQDSVEYVRLKGGKNVLPKVGTTVTEGVLYIENNNHCNPVRSFKRNIVLEIHLTNLKKIYTEGVGEISSADTLYFPALELEVYNAIGTVQLLLNNESFSAKIHTGAVDLILAGKSANLYIYNAGLGYLFCKNLIVPYVHLNHNSTGDAEVHAGAALNLENDGIGSVFYYGNPPVLTVSNPNKENYQKK